MGWPIYSERFIVTSAVNTWVTWAVPDRMRAVVTYVSCVNTTHAAWSINVKAHGYYLALHTFLASEETLTASPRIVLYERETIEVYLTGSGMHTYVGGFLFADPVGRQAAGAVDAPAELEHTPEQLQDLALQWRAG